MFQFSPLASSSLCIQERMTAHDGCRVSPFGHLRISAYVRLPEAFRSLSRPSSPVRAKASTVRPFPLDRICSLARRPSGLPQDPQAAHSGPPPKVLFLSLCYSLSLHPDCQCLKLRGRCEFHVRSTCECLSAPEGAYSAFSERR